MAYAISIWTLNLLMKYKAGFNDILSVGYTRRINYVTASVERGTAPERNKWKYGTKPNAACGWLINPEGPNTLRTSYKMMAGNCCTNLPAIDEQKVHFSHSTRHGKMYRDMKVRSRVQKFPAWHTKAAPHGKCYEGHIVPSMVRLMYQLKSVLK